MFNLNQLFIPLAVLIALAIVGLIGLLILAHKKRDGRVERALNMSLFLITLPRHSKKDENGKNEKDVISVMEQFYSSLHKHIMVLL